MISWPAINSTVLRKKCILRPQLAKEYSSMAKNSRTKGKTGELELANLINSALGKKYLVRNLRQTRDGGHDLDVDNQFAGTDDNHIFQKLASMAIEVKRHQICRRSDIKNWWLQAVSQAKQKKSVPVLFYRADRGCWYCMFPLFKSLDQCDVDNCVTMGLNLFCTLIKSPAVSDAIL